jgi:RimJ/RimL family protein N-acetyltransferase
MKLREVLESDLPAIFEQQRDPQSVRMAHVPPRDHDTFFMHWRANVLGNPTSTARTMDVNGECAGYVASWQPREGSREVGYWVARAHGGRGIASAALEEAKIRCTACLPRRSTARCPTDR